MKKLSKYNCLLIYSITIVLCGTIIGVGIVESITSRGKVENNMITLLSIIVTLGVAYSFYSIYQVSHEFNKLKKKTKLIQHEIKYQSERLNLQSYSLDRRLELYKRNSDANTNFRNRKFLLAIKKELEIVVFVLKNKNHLTGELTGTENEFLSTIGIKRSFIAHDLLCCIINLTTNKVEKFRKNEFPDSQEAISNAIHEIKYTDNFWSLIDEEEQKRYLFLFDVIQHVIHCIIRNEMPIILDSHIIDKLHFYHKGILDGGKSEGDNGMEKWIEDYKSKLIENNNVSYY